MMQLTMILLLLTIFSIVNADYGSSNDDYGRSSGDDYGRSSGGDYGRSSGGDYGRSSGSDHGRSSGSDHGRSSGGDRYSNDKNQYSNDKNQYSSDKYKYSADKNQCQVNKYYEYKLFQVRTKLDFQLGVCFGTSLDFFSTLRFLPCGQFDEFFSISARSTGDLVATALLFLTDRFGQYKSSSATRIRGTGFGYITGPSDGDLALETLTGIPPGTVIGNKAGNIKSKKESKSVTGVFNPFPIVIVHDYDMKFTPDYKRCTGKVEYAIYLGTPLFAENADPILTATGRISCELIKVRRISL